MNFPELDFSFVYLFIFLAIPGLIFRKFYFQGEFSKQFVSKNWAYTLTSSFVIGLFIQLISIYSIKNILIFYKDQKSEFFLFKTELAELKQIPNKILEFNLSKYDSTDILILQILAYLFFTFIISLLLSVFCWKLIRIFKLDRRLKLFRFNNIWNYYLRGEIIDFKDFTTIKEKNKKVLYTLVDVIITDGFKDNKLFSGILSQYTIEPKTNTLETITLTNTSQWKKSKDEKSDNFGKTLKTPIKGHCVILDMKRALDLNITYVYTDKQKGKLTKLIASILSLITISSYLTSFFYLIFSTHPILIGDNILYTVILKIYFILQITFLIAMFSSIQSLLEKTNKKEKILEGTVMIIIFIIIWAIIYRLIRYGDMLFWLL